MLELIALAGDKGSEKKEAHCSKSIAALNLL